MKKFHKILTFGKIIFNWLVYGLSFLFPRDKNLWVFIGWHQDKEREIFADNSKYIFLHAANNIKDIKAIWIGKDKKITRFLNNHGYRSFYINSPKGIYYSLRAGYIFIDAFMENKNWRLSGGSKIIQLWHGKGMKKAGYDTPYSLPRYKKFFYPCLFAPIHLTIASSETTARMMMSAFKLPKEKVIITGLPRNDVLFKQIRGSDIDTNNSLQKILENIKAKKIILYAPTFRPDGSNPLSTINLDELNNFLKTRSLLFFIQLHPKFAAKEITKSKLDNIVFVQPGFDVYPLLKHFDYMITDYSSLYVDFLLLDRPIIFFVYDLEKYKKEMGLYDDFENLTPGPHAKNFSELLKAIDNLEKDLFKQKRQGVQKELFGFIDGGASERIIDIIVQEKVL